MTSIFVGETAEATIKLTGLNDEKAAKYSLSAFQTQFEFNTDELEAVSMDFSEPLKSKIGTAENILMLQVNIRIS